LLSLVFPESFTDGLIYTTIYALGFGALLLLIAYSGRALVKKLNWLADPHGRFKRTLGAVLIMTGVLIAT
jgi:cytochrome c biogenesis protein CcdA